MSSRRLWVEGLRRRFWHGALGVAVRSDSMGRHCKAFQELNTIPFTSLQTTPHHSIELPNLSFPLSYQHPSQLARIPALPLPSSYHHPPKTQTPRRLAKRTR